MIEVRQELPRVYYNESRDFQLLGRLFEAVFNYSKMGVDTVENIYSMNMDNKLVNLLSKTIGFESKHDYDIVNLKLICGCFNDILKDKGTKTGVKKAISALLNAQGIDDEFSVEFIPEKCHIEIYIPSHTQDIVLLKDLFDYILPVGWDYTIISGIGGDLTHYSTTVVMESLVDAAPTDTADLDKVAKLNDEYPVGVTSTGIVPNVEHREEEE